MFECDIGRCTNDAVDNGGVLSDNDDSGGVGKGANWGVGAGTGEG